MLSSKYFRLKKQTSQNVADTTLITPFDAYLIQRSPEAGHLL